MSPQNQIELVVKSTAGTWPNARFNVNNKAQKVLDDGVRHLNLDPSPAVPYVLTHNGTPIALGEKLSELGLKNRDVVVIEAGQPIDA